MTKRFIYQLAVLAVGLLCANNVMAEKYMTKTAQANNQNNQQIQPGFKGLPHSIRPGLLGPGAEVARTWVTPPLVNDPGTSNGKKISVNGMSQREYFILQLLNLDLQLTAYVKVSCYDKNGQSRNDYNRNYNIAPKTFAEWKSSIVTPPASGSKTVRDKETVWCAIKSSIPIFAHGRVYSKNDQGSYAAPICLMRAAR